MTSQLWLVFDEHADSLVSQLDPRMEHSFKLQLGQRRAGRDCGVDLIDKVCLAVEEGSTEKLTDEDGLPLHKKQTMDPPKNTSLLARAPSPLFERHFPTNDDQVTLQVAFQPAYRCI